jgi:hypothetical protein
MSREPDLWRMHSDIREMKKKKSSLVRISEQRLRKLVVKHSWTRLLYLQSVRKVCFLSPFVKPAFTCLLNVWPHTSRMLLLFWIKGSFKISPFISYGWSKKWAHDFGEETFTLAWLGKLSLEVQYNKNILKSGIQLTDIRNSALTNKLHPYRTTGKIIQPYLTKTVRLILFT